VAAVLTRSRPLLALTLTLALLAPVDASAARRSCGKAVAHRYAHCKSKKCRAKHRRALKACRRQAAKKRRARHGHHAPVRADARRPSPVASPQRPSAVAATASAPAADCCAVQPPSGDSFFAPDSIWNRRLPADAPLDPTSGARMSSLLSLINSPGHGTWINTNHASIPIYRVPPDQPTVHVTLDAPVPALQQAIDAVPIPANAVTASGSDSALAIYQPSTDRMWELWRARRASDGWHASYGGAMQNVSTNPGIYNTSSWPGVDSSQQWRWGSTASSLPVMAGTVTVDDLRSGHIRHALGAAAPQACAGAFSWPAQRTDGQSSAPDCLPEGAHLRLDPSLDLSRMGLPPITRMLAEAAQQYGIVIHDTTMNGPFVLYAEDPAPFGYDPYGGPNGLFGGVAPWNFMPKFPWSHLQLLQLHMCTAGPCRA
jgi:hypothetical protein